MGGENGKSGGHAFRSGFLGCLGVLAAIIAVIGVLGVIGAGLQDTTSISNRSSYSGVRGRVSNCGPESFAVSKLKAWTEYDYAHLTGIVRHNCSSAVGVQLKWTAFNADGTVAFANNFWPASTTNIPPNTDYAFEMMNAAPRSKWRYTVEPVGIYSW